MSEGNEGSSLALRKREICPLCQSPNSRELLRFTPANKNNEILRLFGYDSNTVFPIVECTDCDFMYSSLLLSDAGYKARYETLTNHKKSQRINYRRSSYLRTLDTWREIFPHFLGEEEEISLKLLDYGCGWGAFMKVADYLGVECVGLDFDETKAAFVRKNGFEVVTDAAPLAPFDVIVCNQVLEHLPDPRGATQLFASILRPGGFVWLTVPFNTIGLKADIEKGPPYRRVVDPWEHLNYFTKYTLNGLMRESGFESIFQKQPTEALYRLKPNNVATIESG